MVPPEQLSDRERAGRRLRSATNLLYLLALLKLFGLLIAARLLLAPNAAAGAVAIGLIQSAALVITLVLARLLPTRRIWTRNVALLWATLHIAEILLVRRIGVVAVAEALLGTMILITLLVAGGLGAFDREEART